MKKLLYVLFLLLCSNSQLFTQTQDPARAVQALPPQLEEWYSLWGGVDKFITYLPNFRNEQPNALALWYKNVNTTWFLRHKYDTTNQYTWQFYTGNMRLLDFNGDGIRDYLNSEGQLYLGSKESLPEDTITYDIKLSFRNHVAGHRQNDVGDFNNDGADDFYFIPYTPSEVLLNCWFGTKGASNNKVRNTQLTRLPSSNGTTEVALVMYKTNSGETRLLTAEWKEDKVTKGKFYPEYNQIKLYSVQSNTASDTVTSELTLLDSTHPTDWVHPVKYGNKLPFTVGQSFLYKSKQFEEMHFYFGNSCFDLNQSSIRSNGSSDYFDEGSAILLDHSVDQDNIEDAVRIGGYWDSAAGKPIFFTIIYKGSTEKLNDTIGMIPYSKSWNKHDEVLSIGDVTGDGIADIAITNNSIADGTLFRIFKGVNLTTTVQETPITIATLLSPNPVQSGSIVHLQSILSSNEIYSAQLISVDGTVRVVATDVSFASTSEKVSLQLPYVAQGSYILRLRSDRQVQDFSLIIQD